MVPERKRAKVDPLDVDRMITESQSPKEAAGKLGLATLEVKDLLTAKQLVQDVKNSFQRYTRFAAIAEVLHSETLEMEEAFLEEYSEETMRKNEQQRGLNLLEKFKKKR